MKITVADTLRKIFCLEANRNWRRIKVGSQEPVRQLVLCAIMLVMAIAVGTAVMIGHFRDRALDGHREQLQNTGLLLARHFDQQLEDLQRVQRRLSSYMLAMNISTQDDFKREMATPGLHIMLQAETADVFQGNLNLLDAQGRLINWSVSWPVAQTDLSDRDYFRALKGSSNSSLELVEPIVSRIDGAAKTLFARKLTNGKGEFLGAVTRAMEPKQFEDFFASVSISKMVSVSILYRDGTLLARFPHDAIRVGTALRPGPVLQDTLNKSSAAGKAVQSYDGREKLMVVHKLSNYPIDIVVTTPVEMALADWRAQTRFLIGIAILIATVIATAMLQIVKKLSSQKERLDTALNNMSQGLLLFDSSQRLVICNDRYIEIYGVSPQIVKPGATLREIVVHRKSRGSIIDDVDEYCTRVLKNMSLGKSFTMELTDGRCVQVFNRPVARGGWVSTHEDVTDRLRLDRKIAHLAHHDALTDLPNRVQLRERLEQEVACLAQGNQFSLLYIDLDEFKGINDSLGHPVGDELLRSVALRLLSCVREDVDFVARLGGDEFAIIQGHIDSSRDVHDLASRIHLRLREPADCLGHQIAIDASIGIAMAPADGSDIDQLLKCADIAMYGAKANGRRSYRFFEPLMDERVKVRRRLESDLRQAMTDDDFLRSGFRIVYQPLVALSDGEITGCEALLRWNHRELGMVPPDEFIPIAEETGMIVELGQWVLETASKEAAGWPSHIKVAVNVSPIQFRSNTFALKVMATLARVNLPPDRLEIEITEAVFIRDDASALAILHQLRDAGVRVALDDFGTGYSSLSYLNRFPFDKIKIDRCFVTDIAVSACIVQAIVSIAAARGMTTTVEGVETEDQKGTLKALGCTEMQGYLFSRPKHAEELREMLVSNKASAA